MDTKVKYRNCAVKKTRQARPIQIADSVVPFDRVDVKAVNAVFHKSLVGHVLIALNQSNRPVCAWRDLDCIVPIKSKRVPDASYFRTILTSLDPQTLYLNDGQLLRPLRSDSTGKLYNIHRYSDTLNGLLDRLKQLELEKQRLADIERAKCRDVLPTYQWLLSIDPSLTRTEYRKFCSNIHKGNKNNSINSRARRKQ